MTSNSKAAPPKRALSRRRSPLPRSAKKTYAFIALERIGGIMVYDVTDPANAAYVNYVNTRDFNGATEGDVAPEGLSVAERKRHAVPACGV